MKRSRWEKSRRTSQVLHSIVHFLSQRKTLLFDHNKSFQPFYLNLGFQFSPSKHLKPSFSSLFLFLLNSQPPRVQGTIVSSFPAHLPSSFSAFHSIIGERRSGTDGGSFGGKLRSIESWSVRWKVRILSCYPVHWPLGQKSFPLSTVRM